MYRRGEGAEVRNSGAVIDLIEISVADSGIGISAEDRKGFFSHFSSSNHRC